MGFNNVLGWLSALLFIQSVLSAPYTLISPQPGDRFDSADVTFEWTLVWNPRKTNRVVYQVEYKNEIGTWEPLYRERLDVQQDKHYSKTQNLVDLGGPIGAHYKWRILVDPKPASGLVSIKTDWVVFQLEPYKLMYPQSSRAVHRPDVTFEWMLAWSAADTNRVVYQVEHQNDANREWERLHTQNVPIQADGHYKETQDLISVGGSPAPANYKWRILADAKPVTGLESIKTDWVLFQLDDPYKLLSPASGGTVHSVDVTFEWTLAWNPADTINRVVLQVEHPSRGVWERLVTESVAIEGDGYYAVTKNLASLGGGSSLANYKWRILADAKPVTGLESIKTDWVSFQVDAPLLMPGMDAPYKIIFPLAGTVDPKVTFEWSLLWDAWDINRVVYQVEFKDKTSGLWEPLYRENVAVESMGFYEHSQDLVGLGGPVGPAEYKWRVIVDPRPSTGLESIKTNWKEFVVA